MKMHPCWPSFFDARDAIVQMDEQLTTGGENLCELWQGFAERGLGSGGRTPWGGGVRTDDFRIPSSCVRMFILVLHPLVEVADLFPTFMLFTLLHDSVQPDHVTTSLSETSTLQCWRVRHVAALL